MTMIAAAALVAVAGFAGYVRLAPVRAQAWHIDLSARPAPIGTISATPVQSSLNSAYVDLAQGDLARLDAVAVATPRTTRIAGSVGAGHITWQTRSALWGFPDYTTAQIIGENITIFARARFGKSDIGVNKNRLSDWISKL